MQCTACLVVPLLHGIHQLHKSCSLLHYSEWTFTISVLTCSARRWAGSQSGRTTSPRRPLAQRLLTAWLLWGFTASLLRVNIHYFSTHMQCTAMGWQPVWSYHFSTASTSCRKARPDVGTAEPSAHRWKWNCRITRGDSWACGIRSSCHQWGTRWTKGGNGSVWLTSRVRQGRQQQQQQQGPESHRLVVIYRVPSVGVSKHKADKIYAGVKVGFTRLICW